MSDRPDRSAPALLGDLVGHITELFRKEVQLLRAEVNQKTTHAFTACGLIIAAMVIALTALNVLAAALVVAVGNLGVAPGWAALIVGGGLAVLALLMAGKGIDDLKASNMAPERIARAVTEDAKMAKEKMT